MKLFLVIILIFPSLGATEDFLSYVKSILYLWKNFFGEDGVECNTG